jgi:hypothetical protein
MEKSMPFAQNRWIKPRNTQKKHEKNKILNGFSRNECASWLFVFIRGSGFFRLEQGRPEFSRERSYPRPISGETVFHPFVRQCRKTLGAHTAAQRSKEQVYGARFGGGAEHGATVSIQSPASQISVPPGQLRKDGHAGGGGAKIICRVVADDR